jgi:hypothetical protein
MLRLGALLVLLLQLHPIVGAAACLASNLRARAECPMPAPVGDRHTMSSPAQPPASTGCPLAELCAPSGPVVAPATIAISADASPSLNAIVPPIQLAGAPRQAPQPPPPRV